ncbi:TIGR03571 family LLM class oxidoreductase [Roseateles sp. DAIF2]|nr:TIGR03571 family LLM class oxidoreductase [Roseateles sp. DAIF2]
MMTSHNTFARVFREGQLSIGLSLPLLGRGRTVADFHEQLALARLADRLGYAALWVRDVPLNSAGYADPVGHLDPWVLLGALAGQTERIALISGAIVLPLRHPLHIAKGAISTQLLSRERFILGLGSGDRPQEYAAFGRNGEERRELFRRHWATVAAAVAEQPARVVPDLPAPDGDTGSFSLLPALPGPLPLLAVGSGGQSVDWIARNAGGWITYHREPQDQQARHRLWRSAVERAAPGEFRAFGTAMRLELDADPRAPARPIPLGYATGRLGLAAILREMRAGGTHHVALGLQDDGRPLAEQLEELARELLPEFHTQG